MGLRGPKPKPTDIRLLEGNPGRLPINEDEPNPTGQPAPPDGLRPDAAAAWNRIMEAMPPGLYTQADERLLFAYCEIWQDFIDLTRAITEDGTVTSDGVNPAVTARLNVANRLATLGTRLGLSPADRANLKMPKQQPSSKWNGLIG